MTENPVVAKINHLMAMANPSADVKVSHRLREALKLAPGAGKKGIQELAERIGVPIGVLDPQWSNLPYRPMTLSGVVDGIPSGDGGYPWHPRLVAAVMAAVTATNSNLEGLAVALGMTRKTLVNVLAGQARMPEVALAVLAGMTGIRTDILRGRPPVFNRRAVMTARLSLLATLCDILPGDEGNLPNMARAAAIVLGRDNPVRVLREASQSLPGVSEASLEAITTTVMGFLRDDDPRAIATVRILGEWIGIDDVTALEIAKAKGADCPALQAALVRFVQERPSVPHPANGAPSPSLGVPKRIAIRDGLVAAVNAVKWDFKLPWPPGPAIAKVMLMANSMDPSQFKSVTKGVAEGKTAADCDEVIRAIGAMVGDGVEDFALGVAGWSVGGGVKTLLAIALDDTKKWPYGNRLRSAMGAIGTLGADGPERFADRLSKVTRKDVTGSAVRAWMGGRFAPSDDNLHALRSFFILPAHVIDDGTPAHMGHRKEVPPAYDVKVVPEVPVVVTQPETFRIPEGDASANAPRVIPLEEVPAPFLVPTQEQTVGIPSEPSLVMGETSAAAMESGKPNLDMSLPWPPGPAVWHAIHASGRVIKGTDAGIQNGVSAVDADKILPITGEDCAAWSVEGGLEALMAIPLTKRKWPYGPRLKKLLDAVAGQGEVALALFCRRITAVTRRTITVSTMNAWLQGRFQPSRDAMWGLRAFFLIPEDVLGCTVTCNRRPKAIAGDVPLPMAPEPTPVLTGAWSVVGGVDAVLRVTPARDRNWPFSTRLEALMAPLIQKRTVDTETLAQRIRSASGGHMTASALESWRRGRYIPSPDSLQALKQFFRLPDGVLDQLEPGCGKVASASTSLSGGAEMAKNEKKPAVKKGATPAPAKKADAKPAKKAGCGSKKK